MGIIWISHLSSQRSKRVAVCFANSGCRELVSEIYLEVFNLVSAKIFRDIRAWPGLLVGCYLGLTAGAAKKFKLKHSFEKFENSLR